jgi:glycosyltransferase involved in cell wall biosynthesis
MYQLIRKKGQNLQNKKLLHIGIDGNEANITSKVGVNVYAHRLLVALSKSQNDWKEKYRFTIYLKNLPNKDLPPQNSLWKYKVIPGRGLWIIRKLTPHLIFTKDRPNIFFTPSHYTPPLIPITRICSIMDLGYLMFSEQFKALDYWQLKLWSAYSIMVSKCIISISNATKADIIKHYPKSKDKIHVTPLAYDKDTFNKNISKSKIKKVKDKYANGKEYILFLSTLKPSKNIEGLLKAWSKIHSQFPDYFLVIAGKKGWLYEPIYQKTKDLGLEKRVIFTGFVDEKDKAPLITGAKVFVLPSFWEGFGLDILNAFALKTPVICSFKGSLPEVSGNCALLIDPQKPVQISRAIKKVLTMNKSQYNSMIEKAYKRAQSFDWSRTANQTLEVFDKLSKEI